MNNEDYLNISMIYKLPANVFDNADNLKKIIKHINIDEFVSYLKKNNHTNLILSDKRFLLENVSGLYPYKIEKIFDKFLKKEDIDKEFMIDLIERKPTLFTYLAGNESSLFKDKVKDLDIIMSAHTSGIKIKEISENIMKEYFLTNGTKNEEVFKLKYVIHNNMFYDTKVNIYNTPEENKAFKEKYYKLEYMFLKIDNYSYENKDAKKELSKIKDVEAMKKLIENIPFNFELNYRVFYANMHYDLKVNLELLEETGILSQLRFSDLPETLQYNKKVAIQFIGEDIQSIPKEFFNDISFSLEFAKCLDEGAIAIKKAPDFIYKFFDNQNVSSNYYDYLNAYIIMSGINQNLEQKEDSSITKKVKI